MWRDLCTKFDEFNLKNHHFFGPQISIIYGQLFTQGEYQVGNYEYSAPNTGANAEEDFDFHGGSISVAYALSGKFKHSGKKGALGSLKCKSHCFMPKYQYEFIDLACQIHRTISCPHFIRKCLFSKQRLNFETISFIHSQYSLLVFFNSNITIIDTYFSMQ